MAVDLLATVTIY